MRAAVVEKATRIRGGARPRVLDLFSGAGGLSLAFLTAGGSLLGGVEIDPLAALTYARNFHRDDVARHSSPRDITAIDPRALIGELVGGASSRAVDVIIGGPPCPAFARVGRAKLREVHRHPHAFLRDPRALLYVHYLRFVEALAPLAVVMENVPDVLNYGGKNVGEQIACALEAMGYRCAYTLLNAASYAVPQLRERFILVAVHDAVGAFPSFPAARCTVDFPIGYRGARHVALRALACSRAHGHFVPTPAPAAGAPPAVTVEEALRDLPPITAHLDGGNRRGARRLELAVRHHGGRAPSAYARRLRGWRGFESDGFVRDHVTRALSERDYRLFRAMAAGDDYPKAHALAERLLADALLAEGAPRAGTVGGTRLRAQYVPPYDVETFPNRWRKMEPDQPARTLMAHIGKDTYTHIHYDSAQARTISVREAARLQSFPDGFAFAGTMNPAFRQIGNSVPPLLALALAEEVYSVLGVRVDPPPTTRAPTL